MPFNFNVSNFIVTRYRKSLEFLQTHLYVRRALQILTGIFALAILSFITLIITVWFGVFGPLPGKDELRLVQNPVATEVYSADSVLMGKYFTQERSDIHYNDIPPHVVQALIATEDARFYKHKGVDNKSLLRVLIKSILLQQESSGGGSTITQQLAKNLYPRKNYVFLSMPINKIREVIVARRLEQVYDKKSLLTLYLNTIPFGDNAYGIEAASQRFFSVHTKQLSITQGAVLIGMLKATHAYNPRVFPDRALKRRNIVLHQMTKYAMLTSSKFDSLTQQPLQLNYNKMTHHAGLAPYFREYLRQELQAWCKLHKKSNGKPYSLYSDGLKIYTTIDSRLQRYAEEAVTKQMAILQSKFAAHWSGTKPWKSQPAILEDAIKNSDRYKALKKQGLSKDEILKKMSKPVLMNVFTWGGEQEMQLSPIDSIKHYLTFLNTGVLAMDPMEGAIKVWVGGINHHFFQYDHVKESTKRQVGSTFKPIVYAAALQSGVEPCDFTSAEKTIYVNMEQWAPENTEENYDLKYSMEGALAYSVNTVSVKILERAGIDNTLKLARSMGIKSDMPHVPSLALGTADISMTEMITAYSCFANGGKAVTPFYIKAITTSKDSLLQQFIPPATTTQVLTADNAQLMIQMLKRTINEGTGSSLRSQYGVANDIAGKTGTTQSNADGWFIAMTPQLVMGAWVGADDPRVRFRTTALGQGARTALPIVGNFLQRVNKDKTLSSIAQARFAALPPHLEDALSCDLYKSDKNFLEKIFGKRNKQEKRNFGDKKKKGFFKKVFG